MKKKSVNLSVGRGEKSKSGGLTAKGRAKTVAQGVAATKKWHKDNPDYKYKGKGNGKVTSMAKKRR
jgi:hypothetical protein